MAMFELSTLYIRQSEDGPLLHVCKEVTIHHRHNISSFKQLDRRCARNPAAIGQQLCILFSQSAVDT